MIEKLAYATQRKWSMSLLQLHKNKFLLDSAKLNSSSQWWRGECKRGVIKILPT